MTETERRRIFTRIFFDAETIITQGDNALVVRLVDISLQGMLIELLDGQQIDRSRSLMACIHLGGDIQICMESSVANQNGSRVGLHCENIDLDSLTHLRRLVELNAGDTTLLERELSALY